MSDNGNPGDDDFDDKPEREDRNRRDRAPRRGGQREFGAEPDFGAPAGGGYGDRGSPGGGYGDRGAPGGGYGGRGGPGGGGYGDRQPGGYRGGGGGGGGYGDRQPGGYRGGGGRGFGGPPREGGGRAPYGSQEPQERGPRQSGTLKFFNADRGFGFISPDDGGKDVFVHISAIERSGLPQLAEGTKISFETEQDRRGRGPQAVNLQLAE